MPRGGARTGAGRKPGVKIGKIKPETINYFRKVTPQEKKYLDSCLTNYRKALKMKNLTEQELEAIKKAITEAGADSGQIVNEIKNDYATINKGRDGKLYAWYYDGTKEAIVNVETLDVIDNELSEELFC